MRPPSFKTPAKAWLLIAFALLLVSPCHLTADVFWINELHYDNVGVDSGEFVEIVLRNGNLAPPDLGTVLVSLYDSSGQVYDQIDLDDAAIQVTSTAEADYHVWNPTSIVNGTGGIALTVGPNTTHFVSYGGVVTATDGAADGFTSTNLGVAEDESTALNQAIGLTGDGTTLTDFSWTAPLSETAGGLNVGQSFGGATVPEPNGIWAMALLAIVGLKRRSRSIAT